MGVTLDPSYSVLVIKGLRRGTLFCERLSRSPKRFVQMGEISDADWQGTIGGRIATQNSPVGYDRALALLPPLDGVDQVSELRKMRLLLETLI